MQRRIIAAAGIGVLVLAGLVAFVAAPKVAAQKFPSIVEIGGPFTLVDGSGKQVTDRDFRGRYMLIYFGYTHCPDACPTTLNDIAVALDKMPAADRAKVAPIFITVDPERDTPAMIGDYVHAFGPQFVGLTGDTAAITAAEQKFHVYAVKHPLQHGDYGMDHSSIMYVMGPDGVFLGVIGDGSKPQEIATRLLAFGA